MKKLILFLLFSASCWSQANGFIVRQKKLVWESVVITSETNIPELVSKHSRLTIASSDKSLHKGKGAHFKNTCPGASAFMDQEFSFDFEIEEGDGKYRVTISNIVYHDKNKQAGAERYFIEKSALKQDEASSLNLGCLDFYLNRLFTMTSVYKNKM
ncbi:hypothetical protein [uncultured Flavobacterium sp.]|uniref:hypothetical protein n=1 Tax=uncultured Flavobacterium sp. TaxID=165435 RepID=UPI0025F246A0|nr:hypothetical protein [uncultured Flavobacterium sp.]